jgi:hypothetical protein
MVATQHARLLSDGSAQAAWRVASHLYSLAFTRGRDGVDALGVIQLPGPNADLEKLRRTFTCYEVSGDWLAWLESDAIAELAGPDFRPDTAGLWFPEAPVVDLKRLCADLAATRGIVIDQSDSLIEGVPVVYACAGRITEMPGYADLPVHTLWGQIDRVQLQCAPRIALLGDGYLLPQGSVTITGSTYEYSPWDVARATATNLARLGSRPATWISRQRAARLIARDRKPVVGGESGRFVSTAHGSMGATSAHLSASIIQSLCLGWIPPAESDVLDMISPDRFAVRAQAAFRRRSPAH